MSVTQTLTWSLTSDSGSKSLSGSQTENGTGGEQVININYPAGTAAVAYAISFAHATLKSIFLLSDKNATLQFNSTGSPVPTINLVGGTPFVWDVSPGYFSNPFSADITQFFVTCTNAIKLQGRVLN